MYKNIGKIAVQNSRKADKWNHFGHSVSVVDCSIRVFDFMNSGFIYLKLNPKSYFWREVLPQICCSFKPLGDFCQLAYCM